MSTIRLKLFKANLVHLYILNTILETPELPHLKDSKDELLVLKNQTQRSWYAFGSQISDCFIFDMLQNPISSSFGDF